jgi:hypothetical protein
MRLWALALLAAAVLPNAAMAQTEKRYDPYGAQGDTGIDLRCSGGRYVVGVTGATGTNIDRIQLLCARLGPDGSALPSDNKSVAVGGPGGGPNTKNCSATSYVNSVDVYLTKSKKQVRELIAGCTNSTDEVGFRFGAPNEEVGFFPGQNFIPLRSYKCPANMAVTGLTVRYGQHVNAIGVMCDVIVVPLAPPAPPATPTSPPKPVVSIGKPKDGSPAPVVKMPKFVGRWSMTSRSGGSAIIVLNEGDGNELFGTLTSADPRYNGSVTGTADVGGRKFTFTYRDTATGKTGSGKMLYKGFDPNAMIGSVKSDGPPPVEEVWGGARQ